MDLVKIAQKTDIRRVATAVLCSMLAFGATGVLGSILPQDVLRIDGFASTRNGYNINRVTDRNRSVDG